MTDAIVARDTLHLHELVAECIERDGPACDLNHIDVSRITSLEGFFEESPFNGNISQWNVSGVTVMSGMFSRSKFNGDISKWNTAMVQNMAYMFEESNFNGDVSNWDVSSVQNMNGMFSNCDFNKDLSRWDICNVRTMRGMFCNNLAAARTPEKKALWGVDNWDVSNVVDMHSMFKVAFCDVDLSGWNMSKVENIGSMFESAFLTQDVSAWTLSPSVHMYNVFARNQYGLAKQTPCPWNLPIFLEEQVLPEDPLWQQVFAAVEPTAQSLGLGLHEHAQALWAHHENICNQPGLVPLPEGFELPGVQTSTESVNIAP